MTDTFKVIEINVQEKTKIERDFTPQEIEELKSHEKQEQKMLEDMINKANARESALAKLAALGLTEEEIGAL